MTQASWVTASDEIGSFQPKVFGSRLSMFDPFFEQGCRRFPSVLMLVCWTGFDPQGTSGTAWTLTQLRMTDAPYFDAMCGAIVSRNVESGANCQ